MDELVEEMQTRQRRQRGDRAAEMKLGPARFGRFPLYSPRLCVQNFPSRASKFVGLPRLAPPAATQPAIQRISVWAETLGGPKSARERLPLLSRASDAS